MLIADYWHRCILWHGYSIFYCPPFSRLLLSLSFIRRRAQSFSLLHLLRWSIRRLEEYSLLRLVFLGVMIVRLEHQKLIKEWRWSRKPTISSLELGQSL